MTSPYDVVTTSQIAKICDVTIPSHDDVVTRRLLKGRPITEAVEKHVRCRKLSIPQIPEAVRNHVGREKMLRRDQCHRRGRRRRRLSPSSRIRQSHRAPGDFSAFLVRLRLPYTSSRTCSRSRRWPYTFLCISFFESINFTPLVDRHCSGRKFKQLAPNQTQIMGRNGQSTLALPLSPFDFALFQFARCTRTNSPKCLLSRNDGGTDPCEPHTNDKKTENGEN